MDPEESAGGSPASEEDEEEKKRKERESAGYDPGFASVGLDQEQGGLAGTTFAPTAAPTDVFEPSSGGPPVRDDWRVNPGPAPEPSAPRADIQAILSGGVPGADAEAAGALERAQHDAMLEDRSLDWLGGNSQRLAGQLNRSSERLSQGDLGGAAGDFKDAAGTVLGTVGGLLRDADLTAGAFGRSVTADDPLVQSLRLGAGNAQALRTDPTFQRLLGEDREAASRYAENRYGKPVVTGLVNMATNPTSYLGSGAVSSPLRAAEGRVGQFAPTVAHNIGRVADVAEGVDALANIPGLALHSAARGVAERIPGLGRSAASSAQLERSLAEDEIGRAQSQGFDFGSLRGGPDGVDVAGARAVAPDAAGSGGRGGLGAGPADGVRGVPDGAGGSAPLAGAAFPEPRLGDAGSQMGPLLNLATQQGIDTAPFRERLAAHAAEQAELNRATAVFRDRSATAFEQSQAREVIEGLLGQSLERLPGRNLVDAAERAAVEFRNAGHRQVYDDVQAALGRGVAGPVAAAEVASGPVDPLDGARSLVQQLSGLGWDAGRIESYLSSHMAASRAIAEAGLSPEAFVMGELSGPGSVVAGHPQGANIIDRELARGDARMRAGEVGPEPWRQDAAAAEWDAGDAALGLDRTATVPQFGEGRPMFQTLARDTGAPFDGEAERIAELRGAPDPRQYDPPTAGAQPPNLEGASGLQPEMDLGVPRPDQILGRPNPVAVANDRMAELRGGGPLPEPTGPAPMLSEADQARLRQAMGGRVRPDPQAESEQIAALRAQHEAAMERANAPQELPEGMGREQPGFPEPRPAESAPAGAFEVDPSLRGSGAAADSLPPSAELSGLGPSESGSAGVVPSGATEGVASQAPTQVAPHGATGDDIRSAAPGGAPTRAEELAVAADAPGGLADRLQAQPAFRQLSPTDQRRVQALGESSVWQGVYTNAERVLARAEALAARGDTAAADRLRGQFKAPRGADVSPASVANAAYLESLQREVVGHLPPKLTGIGGAVEDVIKTWRQGVLMSLQYHVGNVLDVVGKSGLEGITPYTGYMAQRLEALGLDGLPALVRQTSGGPGALGHEFGIPVMERLGLHGAADEIEAVARRFGGEVGKQPVEATWRGLAGLNGAIGGMVESNARAAAFIQGAERYMRGAVSRLDRELTSTLGREFAGVAYGLPQQTPSALRDALAARGVTGAALDRFVQRQARNLEAAHNAGYAMVSRVHFDYSDRSNLELSAFWRNLWGFSKWATSNLEYYGEALVSRPALWHALSAYDQAAENSNELGGSLPRRLDRFVEVGGSLGHAMAGLAFGDPTAHVFLNPVGRMLQVPGQGLPLTGRGVTGLGDRLADVQSLAGLALAPVWDIPLRTMGVYGDVPVGLPFGRATVPGAAIQGAYGALTGGRVADDDFSALMRAPKLQGMYPDANRVEDSAGPLQTAAIRNRISDMRTRGDVSESEALRAYNDPNSSARRAAAAAVGAERADSGRAALQGALGARGMSDAEYQRRNSTDQFNLAVVPGPVGQAQDFGEALAANPQAATGWYAGAPRQYQNAQADYIDRGMAPLNVGGTQTPRPEYPGGGASPDQMGQYQDQTTQYQLEKAGLMQQGLANADAAASGYQVPSGAPMAFTPRTLSERADSIEHAPGVPPARELLDMRQSVGAWFNAAYHAEGMTPEYQRALVRGNPEAARVAFSSPQQPVSEADLRAAAQKGPQPWQEGPAKVVGAGEQWPTQAIDFNDGAQPAARLEQLRSMFFREREKFAEGSYEQKAFDRANPELAQVGFSSAQNPPTAEQVGAAASVVQRLGVRPPAPDARIAGSGAVSGPQQISSNDASTALDALAKAFNARYHELPEGAARRAFVAANQETANIVYSTKPVDPAAIMAARDRFNAGGFQEGGAAPAASGGYSGSYTRYPSRSYGGGQKDFADMAPFEGSTAKQQFATGMNHVKALVESDRKREGYEFVVQNYDRFKSLADVAGYKLLEKSAYERMALSDVQTRPDFIKGLTIAQGLAKLAQMRNTLEQAEKGAISGAQLQRVWQARFGEGLRPEDLTHEGIVSKLNFVRLNQAQAMRYRENDPAGQREALEQEGKRSAAERLHERATELGRQADVVRASYAAVLKPFADAKNAGDQRTASSYYQQNQARIAELRAQLDRANAGTRAAWDDFGKANQAASSQFLPTRRGRSAA